MNKGDVVKRKGFKHRYEIIADKNHTDTGRQGYAGTVKLKEGYDYVIVNIEEDWPEGKIRPFEDVYEYEIEPAE